MAAFSGRRSGGVGRQGLGVGGGGGGDDDQPLAELRDPGQQEGPGHVGDDHLGALAGPVGGQGGEELGEGGVVGPAVEQGGEAQVGPGQPLNFGDEWVLVFKRVGDKVQLIRRNIHYKAPAGTPLEKAVKQNYTDSVLLALPIVSINPGGQCGRDRPGRHLPDRLRRARHRLHGPQPVDLAQGQGVPEQPRAPGRGDLQRGGMGGSISMRRRRRGRPPGDHAGDPLQPGQARPTAGYKPRLADDRVGHFLNAVKDFGQDEPRHQLRPPDQPLAAGEGGPQGQALAAQEADRLVGRGHRAARVSALRRGGDPRVEQGVREDRLPQRPRGPLAGRRRDDFDPEDVNYCTFRWITSHVDLRDVVPAGQPDHRRDDRRRRHLRRELRPLLEAGICRPDRDGPGLGRGR